MTPLAALRAEIAALPTGWTRPEDQFGPTQYPWLYKEAVLAIIDRAIAAEPSGDTLDVGRLARALHAARVCDNWEPGYGYLDENYEHHDDHGPAEHTEAERLAREYAATPSTEAAGESR